MFAGLIPVTAWGETGLLFEKLDKVVETLNDLLRESPRIPSIRVAFAAIPVERRLSV